MSRVALFSGGVRVGCGLYFQDSFQERHRRHLPSFHGFHCWRNSTSTVLCCVPDALSGVRAFVVEA